MAIRMTWRSITSSAPQVTALSPPRKLEVLVPLSVLKSHEPSKGTEESVRKL